jgi:hypothetical protein
MTIRAKVSVELGIITLLTVVFLILFPRRSPLIDVALAGVALACLALSAGYTKKVVWAASPAPPTDGRLLGELKWVFWLSVPAALLFLGIGAILAYRSGRWSSFADRILNWRILVVFACYLLWALIQQTLFQFYLLGRLLALFPRTRPIFAIIITGISISLVHFPDVYTALACVFAGCAWAFVYYRYRLLLPIAVSHALLGTAFYYGLFSQDLATEWRALLH